MRIDKRKVLEIKNKTVSILKQIYSKIKPFSKIVYDQCLVLIKKIDKYALVMKEKVVQYFEKSTFITMLLENVHFRFHYLVSIVMIAFVAFFVTFYTTGYNTAKVDAASMATPEIESMNEKAYDINYGDHDALVNIAKEVVSKQVSIVEDPVILAKNGMNVIFSIDDYIVDVNVQTKELGKANAIITVETKDTYKRNDVEKIQLTNASETTIVDGTAMTYQIQLNIIDTIAPVISLTEADMTMDDTDDFDIRNFVSVTDNLDGIINEYHVENMFKKTEDDKWEYGKHILVIHAKDNAGNESSREMIVRIYKTETEEEAPVAESKTVSHDTYGSYGENPYAGSIVAEARAQIGKAYVWGGNGPNAFDCSGLVQYVYSKAGIYVPRTSGAQSYVGVSINPNDVSQWRAGDIVTFGVSGNSHAAIYSGHGTLIHALNPVLGIRETSLTGFYAGPIYAVRRVQ